jgi:flagellin
MIQESTMTVINTNTKALVAQGAMTVNARDLHRTMAQLSSGNRINSAADDAAGLAIGNKLTTQIRSLDMSVRNANDAISMLQTADGSTNEITAMLFRMRELAVQSANDTYGTSERTVLNNEFGQLQEQITAVLSNSQWNGMNLLDGTAGSSGTVKYQVGASANDTIETTFSNLGSGDMATALSATIDSHTASQSSLTSIDAAIKQVDSSRSQWGAVINRLTHAADNSSNVSLNSSASRSQIMDTDYAQATAELARSMILDQAGKAMLSQANQQPYYVLALLS